MIYLEVTAKIFPYKMFEFDQSKIVFIGHLQSAEGYIDFTEKTGNKFQIKIAWRSKKFIDAFMRSEFYRVFHGAVITLSQSYNIQITRQKDQL